MERHAFPFDSLSLKTVLNVSLSFLWEHHLPGKLRQIKKIKKKSYVCGSLESCQIGFNFLLARAVVPRDGTACCIWAECRMGGRCFHLGVLGTRDISFGENKHFSICLGEDRIAPWGQSSSASDRPQDELEISGPHSSNYREGCPQMLSLPKAASCWVQRLQLLQMGSWRLGGETAEWPGHLCPVLRSSSRLILSCSHLQTKTPHPGENFCAACLGF